MKIVDKKLRQLIDEISDSSPTPGGGAVSALAGALAASLVIMVCNLTIGKRGYEKDTKKLKEIKTRSQNIRDDLLRLSDDDVHAFESVMKAYKLKGKEKDKKVQTALKNATEVPLKTAKYSSEISSLSKIVSKIGNKNAYSDVLSAGYLSHASVLSAIANVKINLKNIIDQKYKKDIERRLKNI